MKRHFFRNLILRALTPIQKIMQKIGKPEPKIKGNFVMKLTPMLEDGDLLLSREDWRLTNPFVPGFWGHAAIYMEGLVIEAVGEGVRAIEVHEWLYQKDYVCARRVQGLAASQRADAGYWARKQLGKKYDYQFQKGQKSFYCSELFIWSVHKVAKTIRFVKAVTPQDLFEDKLLRTILNSTMEGKKK